MSAAALSAVAAWKLQGWRRRVWQLFALGLVLVVVADTISSWYQLQDGELRFPSIADAFYLTGYVALIAGFALLALELRDVWRARVFDSSLISAALAYCGWVVLIEPSSPGLGLASLTAMAYPVLDVLLLSLLVWLLTGGLGVAYRWLLGSLAFWLAADIAYAQLVLYSSYDAGLLDLAWLFAYLLWGAAALHPKLGEVEVAESPSSSSHAIQVLAPAVSFFCVPLILLVETLLRGRASVADIVAGSSVLGVLASARVVHLVRSEHRYRNKAQQSERYFRSLIENSSDVFTVADERGVIRYASTSLTRVLGYEPDELIGTSGFALVHPEDLAHAEQCLTAVVVGDEGTMSNLLRLRHKNGSWVLLESVATRRLDDPAVGGVVICSRDVGERKAAEAERLSLQQELYHSQKMDAIGRFAGGVAHDFNNLLQVITASTESILMDLAPDQARVQKRLDQTRRAAERAATLTQQLLTFSRRQQPSLEALDLNEHIAGTCGMLRRIIGEHVQIDVYLDPACPVVRADPSQIDQVLFNLALNARDAMPTGGNLAIATHVERRTGDVVTLRVRDEGVGMDDETRARVFEPFFTTKPPGQGTGLGLATVYGVVTQLGGTIRVDSAPEAGTTFTIAFPASTTSPVDQPSLAAPAAPGAETILLVEDEDIVRDVVRDGLEQHGYRVLDTGDPREALRIAHAHQPDLLVTDIRMPHMNGFELFDRLQAGNADLKTIFMTGYSETSSSTIQRAPNTAFIQKPFGISDLTNHVRTLLDERSEPQVAAPAA